MTSCARLLAGLGLTVGLLACGPGGARADTSCSGTLSGSMISPLPASPVLRVHITDASAANLALGERFKAGLQSAGASLSDTGSVTMAFTTSITGLSAASAGTGAVSPEFGQVGTLQGILGQSSDSPPVLTMSISLMDNRDAQIDWVGYVTCKLLNPDMSRVAQDLGYAIGHSIGQDFSPRPL